MNWSNYELAQHSIFHVPKNAIAQLPQASLDILDIPFVYVSFVRLHLTRSTIWTTLWWFNIAIENGPVKIVSFPIDSMVIFHGFL